MTDGGALAIALSELVVELCERRLLDATITCGHAFGGDHEAINLHSALEVAASRTGADAIVVGMGPGSVGTGGGTGFSGMEVSHIVDAATALRARPIVAIRYSDADARPRHRGTSHHTITALEHANTRALVAVPVGEARPDVGDHDVVEVEVPDVGVLLAARGVNVTTMGRRPEADPGFFRHAGAAGVAAAELLG
jgi:hypothetical protein